MYKYIVDYLGGELEVDKSDSKARLIKRIKERLSIKPYLVARLKIKVITAIPYYKEIERYHMKFDPKTGNHRFEAYGYG